MNANFNTSTLARVLDFPNQASAQVGAGSSLSLSLVEAMPCRGMCAGERYCRNNRRIRKIPRYRRQTRSAGAFLKCRKNPMSCRDMMYQLRRSESVDNPNQASAQVGAGSRPPL